MAVDFDQGPTDVHNDWLQVQGEKDTNLFWNHILKAIIQGGISTSKENASSFRHRIRVREPQMNSIKGPLE
ncbi:unnamed protein product [Caretta caretta]